MYKHIFMNPFYCFAAMWTTILLLSTFGWSDLYGYLSLKMTLILLFMIAVSAVSGYFLAKFIRKCEDEFRPFAPRYLWIAFGVLALMYLINFLYAGRVPLIDELFDTGYTYKDFRGLSVANTLATTFSLFFCCYLFHAFLVHAEKKPRIHYAVLFCLTGLLSLTLYNRGLLAMIAFCCALIFFGCLKRLRWWYFVVVAVVAVVAMWAFGVLGNIRSGDAWNDASYFFGVAKINDSYPSFLSDQFSWVYIYLISPIGNLDAYMQSGATDPGFLGLICCIIPTFIVEVLFPEVSFKIPLVTENLTVSTGFAPAYKFGGVFGILFLFLYMVALVWLMLWLSSRYKRFYMVTLALSCCLVSFMFFDNFLNFTNLIFAFFYPLAVPVVMLLCALWRRARGWWQKRRAPVCAASAPSETGETPAAPETDPSEAPTGDAAVVPNVDADESEAKNE